MAEPLNFQTMRLIFLILLVTSCSAKHTKEAKPATTQEPAMLPKETYDSISSNSYALKNLSAEFDVNIFCMRFSNADFHDSCIVKIGLTDKGGSTILDSISVISTFYFSDFFQDTANVISYSTNVNIAGKGLDNYYGDLIVADLNFDGKDDIAVINDSGGNGGAFYSYFIQNGRQKFLLDNFLTDSMVYFPTKINKVNKTLTTYVHAGACCMGEHIYHFHSVKNAWRQTSHKILGPEK